MNRPAQIDFHRGDAFGLTLGPLVTADNGGLNHHNPSECRKGLRKCWQKAMSDGA